jgi:hypothetical protein
MEEKSFVFCIEADGLSELKVRTQCKEECPSADRGVGSVTSPVEAVGVSGFLLHF